LWFNLIENPLPDESISCQSTELIVGLGVEKQNYVQVDWRRRILWIRLFQSIRTPKRNWGISWLNAVNHSSIGRCEDVWFILWRQLHHDK
jgi:hypothetical protein